MQITDIIFNYNASKSHEEHFRKIGLRFDF